MDRARTEKNDQESRRIHLASQLGGFDLRLLRIFRKVVVSDGFSSAQIYLDVSRPAISAAINDLKRGCRCGCANAGAVDLH